MKVLIVGANGLLGSAAVTALKERHQVIEASRSSDITVDLAEPDSIRRMFEEVGTVDAVISCTGSLPFKPLADLTEKDFRSGIDDKVLGQVNLVQIGADHVSDGGSFTLTSGVLSHDPIRLGAGASLVNGALDSFVRAAAIELPRGLRINAVSPGVLEESLPSYGPYFRGHDAVPGKRVANAYVKSVEGALTGQVFHVL